MKKIFFALITLAVLFSCEKEKKEKKDDPSDKKATVLRVGTSTLSFDAMGAESQTVTVYADGSWTSEAPEWVTIDPTTGSGTVTVTVTVSDNEEKDGRVGEIVFAPDLTSTTNKVTVQQKGNNKTILKTGQQFADWLAGLNAESLDEATLGADIDMTGIQLVSAEAFSGVLDGKGYAIKNLTATGPLFKVNKGELKNIVIDASCSFKPDSTVFGAIVARNEGIINDCTNKADVVREISKNASPANHMRSNLIAGIAGMSTRDETISNCKNYGDISIIVTDNGGFTTNGVAGVIALTAGSLSNCENHGDIKLEGGWHVGRACPARLGADGQPDPDGEITQGEIYTTKVGASVGGVAAYVKGGLTGCLNTGKVTWKENQLERISTSPARMFAGGVAGTYYGNCSDCTNEGEFNVISVSSDGSAVNNGCNHQLAMGGVFGACNNPAADSPSKNRGLDISNCINKGAINLELKNYKGWSWFGGVVGYPNGENGECKGTMSACSNTGNITVKGTGRFVVGAIAGTSPNMDGCTNKNTITVEGECEEDASVGGLIGMHYAQKQVVKNCSTEFTISSSTAPNLSGLIGCTDDASSHSPVSFSVEGCTVKGSLSTNGGACGMLMGKCFVEGITITIGSSTAPIEVSGSVNGTTLTQASDFGLFWGTGFDSSVHSVNYVVK